MLNFYVKQLDYFIKLECATTTVVASEEEPSADPYGLKTGSVFIEISLSEVFIVEETMLNLPCASVKQF